MTAEALVVRPDEHGQWHLAEPVPALSVLQLTALTTASLREWLIVQRERPDRIELCGHLFHVAGWLNAPGGGLVLQHLGPLAGPVPPRPVTAP